MAKIILQRANHNRKWFGFNLKPNFYIGLDGITLIATSGWSCNNCLYVYRYDANMNKWNAEWENIDDFHFLNKLKFKGDLSDLRKVKR